MKKSSVTLSFLLLLLLPWSAMAQQEKKTKSLLQKGNWLDFVIIKAHGYSESVHRYEVDVIYLKDKQFKIHAVVNSNNENGKKIDTVFILNTAQLSILENFYNHFQKNDFPAPKLVPAATGTTFSCTLDGETVTVESNSRYSLIEELLKAINN